MILKKNIHDTYSIPTHKVDESSIIVSYYKKISINILSLSINKYV